MAQALKEPGEPGGVKAGFQHDPQALAAREAPFERRGFGGDPGLLHDLAGFV